MADTTDEILIAGAGIAGLTAAVALHRAGLSFRVFERAPALREAGAGVSLWPNAMRALAELGFRDRIPDGHVPMTEVAIRRRGGLRLIRLVEPGRYPEPGICVHRADLLRLLADSVPSERLELDRQVMDFEPSDEGVTVAFADGATAGGRLLVGADGIRSAVRAGLHGPGEPRYQGYEIWRGVSDVALPESLLGRSTEWWAPGQRFGILPGEPGRVYWYATHTTGERSPLDDPATARLHSLFGGWHAPIPALLDAADGPPIRTEAEDRPVPRPWGRGPVTLLGDAAHAMTPNMGQGACTAIEDAVVLGRCLAHAGPSQDALRRYEDARAPRTAWIVKWSRRAGRLGQMTNPGLVAARDGLMRLVPGGVLLPPQRRVYGWR